MKTADLELTTRSCCIYGLPGGSDTEIDDAFLTIFASALDTSNPNSLFSRNIKSETKLVSGKKVKVLIADDVDISIRILTTMRKVLGDFKHSQDPANNPSFLHFGVGDFYHRSCIPVRSNINNKGKLIAQEVPWINHCTVRLNRHTSEIFLLATTTPDISAQLKIKELQPYVRIEVGTQFGQMIEMSNFKFRPVKARKPRTRPTHDPNIHLQDSVSTHEDMITSRDSSADSRTSTHSFTAPTRPTSGTRGRHNNKAHLQTGRSTTPKPKAVQGGPDDIANATSKKASNGKELKL